MKTIKKLVELNNAHTIQLCTTPDYAGHITNLHSVISSFNYAIKIIGDDDIFIYTHKDIDIQQIMDMPVSIDRRYNILVL
jgi:hypothetical protein